MTPRTQIAHILRRFGLGASKAELDLYEPLGVDAALEKLLNYESTDEGFPVSPWELCFDEGSKEVYLDPFRTVTWWSLRLLLTKRPLQEKMTLFWHDHFAVSGTKIEFGPMMLDYLEALRKNATGNFRSLLGAASKTPAMIRWLDADENTKGMPNENFAREVMELFTIGIGNYTEKDVKEAARAFTGWGLRYLVFERGGEKIQETAKDSILKGRPMVAFSETPDLYDDGVKTILGKTGKFDGDQVLDMLASRPETARAISKKMWEFFAYPKPETTVVDRLARVYTDSKGDIKAMIRAIAKSPEFWSENCLRAVVKSPADFTIPIVRQFGLSDFILSTRVQPKSVMTPLAKPMRDASGLIFGLMYKQGMLLLYPPDVSGWEGGQAWITSNNMLERIKTADAVFGTYDGQQPLAGWLSYLLTQRKPPKSSADLVDALIENFDAPVPPEKRKVLINACDKSGGIEALASPKAAAVMFSAVCRLIFGSPEFQFC
ncbi:MAG: DUF1800 domain-containing protein [Fimbriimonadaceae bacterium]